MRPQSLLTAIAALMISAAPSVAQDSEEPLSICDIDPTEFVEVMVPRLSGSWTANNLSGHAVISGGGFSMPMPMPPVPPEPVDMVLTGDSQLSAVNWASADNQEIDFTVVVGSTLLNDAADFIPGLEGQFDLDDATTTAGCDVSIYPQLFASGTMRDAEGEMNWTGSWVVVSSNIMIGAMQFLIAAPEGSLTGYRTVTITR